MKKILLFILMACMFVGCTKIPYSRYVHVIDYHKYHKEGFLSRNPILLVLIMSRLAIFLCDLSPDMRSLVNPEAEL